MEIIYKPIKYNFTKANITPKYIVIHDTGNTSNGADADAHYRYFNGADRGASAHYFVDEKQIIQVIADRNIAWHAGRKYTDDVKVPGCTNKNSIGIEICINQDGDLHQAVDNCILLIKDLMEEYDVPLENVITHKDCTGKNCPYKLYGNGKLEYIYDKLSETEEKPKEQDWKDKAIIEAGLDINYWGKRKNMKLGDLTMGEFIPLISKILKGGK